jgi:preprotein translocase subunit SecG
MITFFNWLTILSAILMTILILMQARGASLGAGFGGSGELHTERRGVDKTLHQITIVTAVVFTLSIALTVYAG